MLSNQQSQPPPIQQQILLLKLLHVPIYILKLLSYLLSILLYLPNYFIILLFDYILFTSSFQKTLKLYILSWPFRFISLNLIFGLFILQISIVYSILDIGQNHYMMQIFIMMLAMSGLVFIMRKGYLKIIQKITKLEKSLPFLCKLKSPLQHIIIYQNFIKDILAIILTFINIILIKNIFKTFQYQYQLQPPYNFNRKNKYLKHISSIIHSAIIFNLSFFYLKIFFKIFKWRYLHQIQDVQKQMENKNILNLMVLLTLLYWQTILDILFIAILGGFCIIHWKKYVYTKNLSKDQKKYKVTINHFSKILLQLLQLFVISLCLILNYKSSIILLKKILQRQQKQKFNPQSFIQQCSINILKTLLKIPRHFSFLIIYLFCYKYKKYLQIKKHNKKQNKSEQQDYDNSYKDQLSIIELFIQQLTDLIFIPLVFICTFLKPLNIKWILLLINQQHNLQRNLIIKYFKICIMDIFWISFSLFFSFIGMIYLPSYIYNVGKGYYILNKNRSIKERITIQQSIFKQYSITILIRIKKDIPYLPFYILMKLSFLHYFSPQIQPQTCFLSFQQIMKIYYISKVNKSPRSSLYLQIYQKDQATGIISTQLHKYLFWKYSYKCQRYILITKIISYLIPKKRYQKRIQTLSLHRPLNYSFISNEYWHCYQIMIKMVRIFLEFMIQIIITFFGLIILTPLTLWRLPTFIIIYQIHKSKRLFFKIIFEVYKVMLFDFISLIVHILGFLFSPISYVKFRINTLFKYNPEGYKELVNSQIKKFQFILKMFITRTIQIYSLLAQIFIIYLINFRKKEYMNEIKRKKISLKQFKHMIFKQIQIPTFGQLISLSQSSLYKVQNNELILHYFQQITNKYIKQSLKDIPFLIILIFILIIMPWRIFYILKTIKLMKQNPVLRYQSIKLLKKVFIDYYCIIINITLLFSLVKTKKAIQLIIRNYRLNFFVGFLKYSFRKQLQYELMQAIQLYYSFLLIFVTFLINWPNSKNIYFQLYSFYKTQKQQKQIKKQNQKIYQNTIKQKKGLQIIDKLGYYQYLYLASFLNQKQLITLSQTSKYNYMMVDQEEIWIQKWQMLYSKDYEKIIKGDTYRDKCTKAYIMINMKNQHNKPIKYTYNQLIRLIFKNNVYGNGQKINIPLLIKPNLSLPLQQNLYKNYSWSIFDGYGPQNQLPQQQNQDLQFVRLLGQVRRQKQQIKQEYQFYCNLLFIKPIQKIARLINNFYSIDSKRKLKQFTFIILIIAFIFLIKQILYNYLINFILFHQLNRFIGIKILIFVYLAAFFLVLFLRLRILFIRFWISLKPFNIILDPIKFIINKIICFKNWMDNKIYTPVKDRILKVLKFILKFIYKIIDYIVKKIKYASKVFVQKVASPLYIYCVQKIIMIKNLIKMLYKATRTFFAFIFRTIVNIFRSFYSLLKLILKNMNKLYFYILFSLRKALIKFGIIGQLFFTIIGLVIMISPSIICYLFYQQRWYIIISTIHTVILMILGYKHLKIIKNNINNNAQNKFKFN